MNWLKDLFWCETWSDFFKSLGAALLMLFGFWAFIWAMYIFFGE